MSTPDEDELAEANPAEEPVRTQGTTIVTVEQPDE